MGAVPRREHINTGELYPLCKSTGLWHKAFCSVGESDIPQPYHPFGKEPVCESQTDWVLALILRLITWTPHT